MPPNDRTPPAFQEYASSLMSLLSYRQMGLEERGLLMSMRLECWVNFRLPSDCFKLGRVLGFDDTTIRRSLTADVLSFFTIDGDYLTCPELEAYRAKLIARNEGHSKGGKTAVAKINAKRKLAKVRASSGVQANSTGNPQDSGGQPDSFLIKTSTVKQSQNQSTNGADKDPFIADMDKADAAAAYSKASGR